MRNYKQSFFYNRLAPFIVFFLVLSMFLTPVYYLNKEDKEEAKDLLNIKGDRFITETIDFLNRQELFFSTFRLISNNNLIIDPDKAKDYLDLLTEEWDSEFTGIVLIKENEVVYRKLNRLNLQDINPDFSKVVLSGKDKSVSIDTSQNRRLLKMFYNIRNKGNNKVCADYLLIVTDIDKLMEATEKAVGLSEYKVAVRVSDEKISINWNNTNDNLNSKVSFNRSFYNSKWVIAIEAKENANIFKGSFLLLFLLGILVAIILSRHLKIIQGNRLKIIKNEIKYRNLYKTLSDGFLILNDAGVIIECNESLCKMCGLEEKEVLGTKYTSLFAVEDQEKIISKIKEVKDGSDVQPFETVFESKDGTGKIVEVKIYLSDLGIDLPEVYLSSIKDISESKKVFVDLSTYNKRMDLIVEVTSSVFVTGELKGKLDRYLELIKDVMDVDVCIIRRFKEGELIFLDSFGVDKSSLAERMSAGWGIGGYIIENKKALNISDVESNEVTKDYQNIFAGRYSFRSYAGVPLMQNNEVLGIMGIYTTTRKRAFSDTDIELLQIIGNHIALLIHNNELIADVQNQKLLVEKELEERKTIQNELVLAIEKARESQKAKSAFFANMSHEIRTPLTGILGYAGILAESLKDERYSKMGHNILVSGKRLLHTLDQILDIAKLESENVKIRLEPFDIILIIKETVHLLKNQIEKKQLTVEFGEYQEFVCITDYKILHDVIYIILDNAVKYTEKGSIKISVNEKQNELEILIRDTGIGISDEKLEIIFEEFRQESEGHNRSFEGTGLGLAIAKKYIELLNGKISVESKFSEGTEFRIILPMAEKTNIESEEIEEKNMENLEILRIKRVLLVENDEINIQVITAFLMDEYHLDIVKTSADAIKICNEQNFDVILMDINLGKGPTGLDAAREIKLIPKYKKTPIIASTAFAMRGDKAEFLSKGCTHYIAKPFLKDELIKIIESAVFEMQNLS